MTFREALKYLNSFTNYETLHHLSCPTLYLDRIFALLDSLGNPHRKLKFIHVAGTKGKGSTCAFAANILQCAGYKVGLYTSPHLHDILERVRIFSPGEDQRRANFSGKISEKDFAKIIQKLKPAIKKVHAQKTWGSLSYFEILTVLAFCYFAEKQVDFVILETGLGGRLDATNVVDSLVCALTPISLEHTQILGSSLPQIAREKAAIIKSTEQIVVVAPQPLEVAKIIRWQCTQFQTKTIQVGKDIKYQLLQQSLEGQSFRIQASPHEVFELTTSLLGEHQIVNATMAVVSCLVLRDLGFRIAHDAVVQGILKTTWPGRFEVLHRNPCLVVDGAHNPASAESLTKTLRNLFPQQKVILILGVSADKDLRGICQHFKSMVQTVISTKSQNPRAHQFNRRELNKLFPKKEVIPSTSVREALAIATKKARQEDVIVVTGSLFVVGEARCAWLKSI